MIYELRTYRCMPGRVADVIARFGRDVVPLWARHGVSLIGFWTVEVGNSSHDVIYLLRWESAAERDAKWQACGVDAEWLAARAKSEENGPLVMSINNQLLKPAPFSNLP